MAKDKLQQKQMLNNEVILIQGHAPKLKYIQIFTAPDNGNVLV